ncbi:MAG: Asp-tRNA(Asn)/Glu-tRNA(Gln) amidotransferase subunit GatA [Planctomycetales bacterium]|nr:Asp-tRNA(Asn)/Glu-tRNA(Gln) amidotransferase subunit GatA [Planctomycetales bacterium]
MSLLDKTASELLADLEAKETTAVEVTTAFLEQIKKADETIGAFLSTRDDLALAEAAEVDRKRAVGEPVGLLGGLPVAIKDLLCTKGEVTSCASKMLAEFRPPYDATVVQRLRDADGVIIGKTNMDEFAMGGSTENSALGVTRNPWNTSRVPGGSSGGAAACVGASMAPLSIGTDTGGSIRQPSSYCGVVGLKPSYGRVSRYGLVAFASSLDQIGPIAHTVEDAALLLEAIAGHDPADSTSANVPTPSYTASVRQPLQGLRLGIAREHFGDGLDGEVDASVREAIKVFESQGATVRELSLPHSKYAIATYYIIAPCEASSNLARYDGVHYGYRTDEKAMLAELAEERKVLEGAGDRAKLEALDTSLVRMYRKTRSEGFGAEVKRRIMLGSYALSAGYYDAYYVKALKVRRLIREDYDAAFKDVDLIIGPTTATPAFKLGEMNEDPLAMYLQDLYTVSANLAGIAAISVPCGISKSGLPIGLQLQAPPFEEERLLRAAHMFQQATDWHTKRPN